MSSQEIAGRILCARVLLNVFVDDRDPQTKHSDGLSRDIISRDISDWGESASTLGSNLDRPVEEDTFHALLSRWVLLFLTVS